MADHQRVIGNFDYQRVEMQQKLPKQAEVQLLVNAIMPWAEAELKKKGRFYLAAAWLVPGSSEPEFRAIEDPDANQTPSTILSMEQQEAALTHELRARWQRGELGAAILVAPVLYGRKGSGERSQAVRLHVEARGGYCADILMPYRIRARRWGRDGSRNRVHFSHPVAQESDSRFSDSPTPA
jgi:hypothetical protein